MGALGVWALAVAVADLIAPSDTDTRGRLRMWLASLGLPAGAAAGGTAIGLSSAGVLSLVVVTCLSGWLWLWLWRSGFERTALAAVTVTFVGLLVAAGQWTAGPAPLGRLLSPSPFITADPELVALRAGLALLLVATGNRAVRIVLGQVEQGQLGERGLLAQEAQLKGGRVIGPLERLLIYGLGVSGQLVAAGLVVAAKSLLRFSELRSRDDDPAEGIAHRTLRAELMSEYLLVGSLLSWTLAFAVLAVAVAAASAGG